MELANYYNIENPDIILLNATGVNDDYKIKIFTYKIYQQNRSNEEHAGVAIAIKNNIPHKIDDNFQDVLGIEIQTSTGPLYISTAYLPPRNDYYPYQDVNKFARKRYPAYLIGDLNARHHLIKHNDTNAKGRALYREINRNNIRHLGPDFDTLAYKAGRPDIILGNRNAYFNIQIKAWDIA